MFIQYILYNNQYNYLRKHYYVHTFPIIFKFLDQIIKLSNLIFIFVIGFSEMKVVIKKECVAKLYLVSYVYSFIYKN